MTTMSTTSPGSKPRIVSPSSTGDVIGRPSTDTISSPSRMPAAQAGSVCEALPTITRGSLSAVISPWVE
jgi:hypothetical protein